MLGPSLAAAALAKAPPRGAGPLVIGCGALKPRPSAASRFQNLLGAGTLSGLRLFVTAQLCVRS